MPVSVPECVPVCACMPVCVCGVSVCVCCLVCLALRPKPTCQNASAACGFTLWMCATVPEAALRKGRRRKRRRRRRGWKSRRTSTLKLTRTRTRTRTNAGVAAAAAWLAWGVCHERGVCVCVRVCSSRSNALLVSPSFMPTTPTPPPIPPSSILSGCISPAFRMHEVKPLSCWLSLDLDLGLVS